MFEAHDIAALRREMGLSLSEFAARLGVTPSAVFYWESGRNCPRRPAMRLLDKMAKELARACRRRPARSRR